MEIVMRKPFQGVMNIIRFNWHFYLLAFAVIALCIALILFDTFPYWIALTVACVALLSTTVSLVVSYYIYDYSALYQFDWLEDVPAIDGMQIVNIHAGFDETSTLLMQKFPDASLQVFDFYDPEKHTEVSIKRAREAYAPFPGTIRISTGNLPRQNQSVDVIFNIFALHEIRDHTERTSFLRQQFRTLNPQGTCVIVEHLRDVANLAAYNVGFFHFLPEKQFKNNFDEACFHIEKQFRVTPFVKIFILKKKYDGHTH
jgi:SAM-dependent methyltransferase